MSTRTEPARPARYLRILLIGTGVAIGLFAGVNRLIDPFGLFDGPRIEGLNANKPEFAFHLRLAKAQAVRRVRPRAIVLGTSRGEIGIDPQHPGWGAQPVYNLALSSANLYEAWRYLQHAQAIAPLQQVVLMLDFFMFNANENIEEGDFDERRLAVAADGQPQEGAVNDLLTAVGSIDTLFASVQTVRQQRAADLDLYRADGYRFWKNHARAEIRRQGGQRAAFQQNEKGYFSSAYARFTFANARRDNRAIYRQLVQFAHRNGIDLRIAISPSHARQFETIAAKGLWPLFEDWKRMLVRVNAESAWAAGKAAFPIWDFSGYGGLTSEPVPPPSDTTSEMRWYWESSHYKKELGDLALDRIFDHRAPGRSLPDDFGILLTPEALAAHLVRVNGDRQRWRATFPADVDEIEQLMKTVPVSKVK